MIASDEDAEEEKNDNMKGKEEDEIPDEDCGEDMSTQGVQNEGQENKMGNPSDCHGDNDGIKGFCETISKMAKDISNLKTDLNVIKNATIGEKPLSENVKELVVAINNVEAIEAMVGKILETEKKVKELEGNKEANGLETAMNNLANRVDKMELTVKRIAEQNFQILKASVDNMNILINRFDHIKDKEGNKDQMEKKGHEKRTRANTRKRGDIKGRELDELKNSADNMKQMVVHAEDIIKNI